MDLIYVEANYDIFLVLCWNYSNILEFDRWPKNRFHVELRVYEVVPPVNCLILTVFVRYVHVLSLVPIFLIFFQLLNCLSETEWSDSKFKESWLNVLHEAVSEVFRRKV